MVPGFSVRFLERRLIDHSAGSFLRVRKASQELTLGLELR